MRTTDRDDSVWSQGAAMRVLMLGWEFPPRIAGGLGTACHGLTRALDRLGHEVWFVMPVPGGDGIARPRRGFARARFVGVDAGIESSYAGAGAYESDLAGVAQRYTGLVAEAAPAEFDVVHAHDWMTFPAGLAVASRTGRPLVVHVHSTEADRSGAGAAARGAADVEGLGVRAAARVIAVSEVTAAACVAQAGADPANVTVVYNGIEGRMRTPAPVRRAESSDRVVLFLGRMTAQKGPSLFLLAARRVLALAGSRARPIRFVMAGDGDERRALERLAEDLGIGARVEFPGFLGPRAVARAYDGADALVVTSLAEPFGMTVLEGLVRGVPVVAPPWAGVVELLPGLPVCPPQDAEALALAVLRVLDHPVETERMVLAAQRTASEWTWKRAAEGCVEVYTEVLKKKHDAVGIVREMVR